MTDVPPEPAGAAPTNRLSRRALLVLAVVAGVVLIAAPFTLARAGSSGGPAGEPAAAGPANSPLAASSTPDASSVDAPGQGGASASGSPAPSPAPSASHPSVTLSTGPGCADTTAASYHRVGSYDDGTSGWRHTGSGCGGQTDSMPMSGSASSADAGTYSSYQFQTAPVRQGRCAVTVLIADKDDIEYIGGNPAYYQVFDGMAGSAAGTFTVDQPGNLGRWVAAGSFPVTAGRFVIHVTDQGQDWAGSTATYRHVAAGPIRITCS